MKDLINEIYQSISAFKVDNPTTLEQFRIKFLGSKSEIKNLFGELKNVPNEQKKKLVNY